MEKVNFKQGDSLRAVLNISDERFNELNDIMSRRSVEICRRPNYKVGFHTLVEITEIANPQNAEEYFFCGYVIPTLLEYIEAVQKDPIAAHLAARMLRERKDDGPKFSDKN